MKRADYIKIGKYCKITSGVQFLCHDYSWSVLRRKYDSIFPDPGKSISIGDNVFIGWNALIMGPTVIGSNVIIGANSVVTHDVPDDVVVAGNPARIICTLDEYYSKKQKNHIEYAKQRAIHIIERQRRKPTKEDMRMV